MAKTERTPRKGKVKDIVAALLNSEIPEIRTIIGELTECTKQLEEHSHTLQNYAVKIQELSGEEVEGPVEANLVERLRNVEKALTAAVEKATRTPAKPKPEIEAEVREEMRDKVEERKAEMPVKLVPAFPSRVETFITPEGFVVRKRRY